MPDLSLQQAIQHLLTQQTGQTVRSLRFKSVGGGSINQTYQLQVNDSSQYFFCKINTAGQYPGLFRIEQEGLALLAAQQVIHTPGIVVCEEVAGFQVLVLEWVERGLQTDRFWQRFGEQLAALHRLSAARFGLVADNYMGALPQDNTPCTNWVDFFIQQRLEPQIRLARERQLLNAGQVTAFDRLYQVLPALFAPEPPALVHGDLWSGNFMCNEAEEPVLIDPAVYYGHRSMDLAMTTLFGGFSPAFYEAYHYHYPFPSDYREQWEMCNLYPLLIHLNLFGRSYLADILHTIQRY